MGYQMGPRWAKFGLPSCAAQPDSTLNSIIYHIPGCPLTMYEHCFAFLAEVSQGHKARGQGQGHKKSDAKAKDRLSRGQGPRTKPQVFSKKKGLQKSYSGNLQFIGVARIFVWRYLNHKSRAMTSSKICLLTLNQDFAKREGLN